MRRSIKRRIPVGLIAFCFWVAALGVVTMAWSVCGSCGSASASARSAQKCVPAG